MIRMVRVFILLMGCVYIGILAHEMVHLVFGGKPVSFCTDFGNRYVDGVWSSGHVITLRPFRLPELQGEFPAYTVQFLVSIGLFYLVIREK